VFYVATATGQRRRQRSINQLQWHWGTGATGAGALGQQQQNRVATALGQEQQGPQDSDCNGAMGHMIDRSCFILQRQRGNGNGGDRSFPTGQRQWGNRSNCNSNGALGHWGNSNRTVLQWQWQWGATIDRVAIAAQNIDNSGC
jgi:hypothetical protein